MSQPENPRTIRDTLRRIGYAAAFVSGSAAAVYTLSSALRRHDLSAIWMLDKSAAPPPAIQRELRGDPYGSDSDVSDEFPGRHVPRRQLEAGQQVRGEERRRLEEEMNHAVRKGNMRRVQELAGRVKDLQQEEEAAAQSERWQLRHGRASENVQQKRSQLPDRHIRDQLPRRHSSPARPPMRGYAAERDSRESYSGGEGGAVGMLHAPEQGRRRSWDNHSWDGMASFGSANASSLSDQDRPPPVRRDDSESSYTAPITRKQLGDVHRQDSGCSLSTDNKKQVAPPSTASLHSEQEDVPRGSPHSQAGDLGAGEATGERPRAMSRKRTADAPIPSSAVEAEAKLKAGDLVKAECPFTREWHDATIRAVRGRGLVEVRWHNPGMDSRGKPFSRYGDVWADKVQIVFRKDTADASNGDRQQPTVEEHEYEPKAASAAMQAVSEVHDSTHTPLRVGDECYARGRIVDIKWFKARVLALRSKSPPIRVEYLETFDGDKAPLLLPEPRKAFVHEGDVSCQKPDQAACAETFAGPATAPASPEEQTARKGNGSDDSGDPIDEDLMCSVCLRPDDEQNMLVCDCNRGYHTYCLVPKLSGIPTGKWQCPHCTAGAHP